MPISNRNSLTDRQAARFFRAVELPRQRQYEAVRAYFLDEASSAAVARRFH
jgi:hypothetical protein